MGRPIPGGAARALVGFAFAAAACSPNEADSERQTASDNAKTIALASNATALAENGQPLGRVYSAGVVDGKRTSVSAYDLPDSAYSLDPTLAAQRKPQVPASKAAPKMDDQLSEDIRAVEQGQASDRTVEVVVTFVEDQQLPRFPKPDRTKKRDAPENQQAVQTAHSLVTQIQNMRAPNQDRIASDLAALGAKEMERFWLINGMMFSMPLSSVRGLLARPDVQYVEYRAPKYFGMGATSYITNGRWFLNTDSIPGSAGWIGTVDTGIRTSHQVLSNPNVYGYVRDCVHGTSSDCSVGTGLDPNDDLGCFNGDGHGTSIANILSGNGNWGDNYLGVTDITIDSWKVVSSCSSLTVDALSRAFAAAVSSLDNVITTSIYIVGNSWATTYDTIANAAYDQGAVVVGLVGNYGESGVTTINTVVAPGDAKKVLGIGAFDAVTWGAESFSTYGPLSDGRIKPDLVGPDNIAMATAENDTAWNVRRGTSFATPFVAGEAGLVADWFDVSSGQVNAFMILNGANRNFLAYGNTQGAGVPQVPANSWFWWGAISVSNNQNVDVSIDVGTTPTQHVNAAIWWPDPSNAHNDIDLRLYNPGGTQIDASTTTGSVFEKVSATSSLQSGTWKIRVYGYSVTGTQTVYWAMNRQ
jgi:hypothetical protein